MSEEIRVEDQRAKFAMVDEWAFNRIDDDGAFRLYALLAMSVYGEGFKLSRAYLAERCRCSTDTIDRRLAKLCRAKVLRIVHTTFNGGSGWNKYVLLAPEGAANMRPPSPHGRGPRSRTDAAHMRNKQDQQTEETPLPPSGGKTRRTAKCSCGETGVVGVDVFRHTDSTAPYGKRTQYLHEGCKPRVQYGVQERISTSNEDKDWL